MAIAMWDFSWLERRWPGAGYEVIEAAIDELAERGYNAVRIDAYPHFHAHGPTVTRTVLPCWSQQMWGTPCKRVVRLQPDLTHFVRACRDRGIRVALSSWYQDDLEHIRLRIPTAKTHADQWIGVLDDLAEEGLIEHLIYVDLCNEWPLPIWAPFFSGNIHRVGGELPTPQAFDSSASVAWIVEAVAQVRQRYPDVPLTFSMTHRLPVPPVNNELQEHLDVLDAHVWMIQSDEGGKFYERLGYDYQRFESVGYERLVDYAEPLYRADPQHWQEVLRRHVRSVAAAAKAFGQPLFTTEGWALVDWKDWPGLNWEWIKELCAVGVREACATGAWSGLCTSNFCGPQFVGMWRDVDWHHELTDLIRGSGALQKPATDSSRAGVAPYADATGMHPVGRSKRDG